MYDKLINMYNKAGNWEKAHQLATQFFTPEEVSEMYLQEANKLEDEGKYRDAEKLYLSIKAFDKAIAMYKRIEDYDKMVCIFNLLCQIFLYSIF